LRVGEVWSNRGHTHRPADVLRFSPKRIPVSVVRGLAEQVSYVRLTRPNHGDDGVLFDGIQVNYPRLAMVWDSRQTNHSATLQGAYTWHRLVGY
jgi:hypothetical protein